MLRHGLRSQHAPCLQLQTCAEFQGWGTMNICALRISAARCRAFALGFEETLQELAAEVSQWASARGTGL